MQILRFYYLPFIFLVIAGCERENEVDLVSAQDNALSERVFSDIFGMIDQEAKTTDGIKTISCADTIIVDTLSSPRTITVDFGTENGDPCADGQYRRGRIIASFTGRYRDEGTLITISLIDYFVDDYHVTGTKKIFNNGRNSSGNLHYTVTVSGASITNPSGSWTSTWESSRVREWTGGESTPLVLFDDEYSITGDARGTNRFGNDYEMSITSPLKVQLNCSWITQGELELNPNGKPTRYVDYGSGACDNNVSVTVNGNVFIFRM